MTLSLPVSDAGLLSLCLLVFSASRRPPFAGFLAAAFLALLVADGLYLGVRSSGPYAAGDWSEMVWALGLCLLGMAALGTAASAGLARGLEIGPRGVLAFWLGPLSPAVHYGFLLAWGAFRPPLPPYALLGGTFVLLYLAFRTSFVARVAKRLRVEQEGLAVRAEQGHISEELHDGLKQDVHSIALMLGTYRKVRDSGNREAAEGILDRAMEVAREVGYRVSRPVWELRARSGETAPDLRLLVDRLARDLGGCFEIGLHGDVEAPQKELGPGQIAAVYGVVSEALWNAAKHSGARNVWVESRREGETFSVQVRDDGRGFSAEAPPRGSASRSCGLGRRRPGPTWT